MRDRRNVLDRGPGSKDPADKKKTETSPERTVTRQGRLSAGEETAHPAHDAPSWISESCVYGGQIVHEI